MNGWTECICVSRGVFSVVCVVGRVWVEVVGWLGGVWGCGLMVVWVWLVGVRSGVWCVWEVGELVCCVGGGGGVDRSGPEGECWCFCV